MKWRTIRLYPNKTRAKGRKFFNGEGMVDTVGTSLRDRIRAGAALGIDSNNIYLLYLRSTKARSQRVPLIPSQGLEILIYFVKHQITCCVSGYAS